MYIYKQWNLLKIFSTYIYIYIYDIHAISCSTHVYQHLPRWFPRYIVVQTNKLIELIKDNPFHDHTNADEKYQSTCMIDFRGVFRDGENVERIHFRGGIVGNVKKHAVPSVYCTCTSCTCNETNNSKKTNIVKIVTGLNFQRNISYRDKCPWKQIACTQYEWPIKL